MTQVLRTVGPTLGCPIQDEPGWGASITRAPSPVKISRKPPRPHHGNSSAPARLHGCYRRVSADCISADSKRHLARGPSFSETSHRFRPATTCTCEPSFAVNADSAASWNVLLQASSEPYNEKMSLDFTGDAELNAVHSNDVFLTSPFPTRQWACIEGHFFLSDVAGRIGLSVDGQTVGQETELDTAVPPGGLTTVFFGILAESGNTATLQVEYDDVVFSRNPIGGCD